MIKRHTWGAPGGNLPFSLSVLLSLFIICCLLFILLIFSPGLGWEVYFAVSSPWWFNSTIACNCIYNSHMLGFSISYWKPSDLSTFHILPTVHLGHISFFSVSLDLPHMLNFPAQSMLGRKISVCSGSVFIFFSLWGDFTCTPQDEWLERPQWEITAVKQYNPLLSPSSWMDRLRNVKGRCAKANHWK